MRPALRTRSRRESLADDFHASAGLLAFVQQLRPELPPARIQHSFRHARPGQLRAAHIADDYSLVTLHHGARKLVQGVRPTAGGLAMDPSRGLPVRSTLRLRQSIRVALSPASRFQAFSIARNRHILQT